VEPHLSLRQLLQPRIHTSIPKHSKTNATVRNQPQLLFHRAQVFNDRFTILTVEYDRKDRRKPADGARKIDSFEYLFSAVSLQIDQKRGGTSPRSEGPH